MHRHNALAHQWKAAVADHVFDLRRVLPTFKEGGFWKLYKATFNTSTRRIEFQFDPFTGRQPKNPDLTYVLVYNSDGIRLFDYYGIALAQDTALLTDVPDARGSLAFSFTVSKIYGTVTAYDASVVPVL
jgi:hypothetical protein